MVEGDGQMSIYPPLKGFVLLRTVSVVITTTVLIGVFASAALAADIADDQQLPSGASANYFNKDYGKSVIENVNNFG
ncbi:hypothetical protein ACIBEA_42595 [Streptomyces sp. NPDC051555]|uniref:hypothetical protein n=1 Tax=Streptomyces sp. NPDC051555 TaxID=3365657 RepID=UPI003789B65B